MNLASLSAVYLLLFDASLFMIGSAKEAKGVSKHGQNFTATKQDSRRGKVRKKPLDQFQYDTYSIIRRLLRHYNKQQPPLKDGATEVKIGIYVDNFYSISVAAMAFSLSIYLHQAWHDPRLTFNPIDDRITTISLLDETLARLWSPDTFLKNEKSSKFHQRMCCSFH